MYQKFTEIKRTCYMVLTLYTYRQYQYSPYSYLYNYFAAHKKLLKLAIITVIPLISNE